MKSKFLIALTAFFSISASLIAYWIFTMMPLENDPQFKSAEYSYLSGKEIKVQGRAVFCQALP